MLDHMAEHTIIIEKKNGAVLKDVKASVQTSMVFVPNAELIIETGDRIIHNLPNGLVDTYLITDNGYHGGVHGIPPHYQCKVRKENVLSTTSKPAPQRVVIKELNISNSTNSSININSTIQNLTQSIQASPLEADNKKILEDLTNELITTIQNNPLEEKEVEIDKLLKRLELLVDETNMPEPNKERLEVTAEGLLSAASKLALVIPPVLTISEKIVDFISTVF